MLLQPDGRAEIQETPFKHLIPIFFTGRVVKRWNRPPERRLVLGSQLQLPGLEQARPAAGLAQHCPAFGNRNFTYPKQTYHKKIPQPNRIIIIFFFFFRAGEVESTLIFSKTNCAAECSGIALHTWLNGKGKLFATKLSHSATTGCDVMWNIVYFILVAVA